MHSHHINYLMAQDRAADLRRRAEQARLGGNDQASKSPVTSRALKARTFGRLRLRIAGSAAGQSPS